MKKVLKALLILLIIIIAAAAVLIFFLLKDYRDSLDTPAGDSTEIVEFTIEEGETTTQITHALKESGLINNELYFRLYLRQEGLETELQAGSFRIPGNLTIKEIAETLQHAAVPDVWATIPEGLMATEITDILEEAFSANPNSSFDKAEFSNMVDSGSLISEMNIPIPEGQPLEGYLFPDTYRFPSDSTTEYVLATILRDGFRTKIYEKYLQEINHSDYSMYEILNLASILERETRHTEDRPLVADILIRRLENNWALEVDATLLYYFNDWTHVITYQDLQLDTPYNTRKHNGFPPTPISNPGEESIKAILYPEPNENWFYISDLDGILHYAVTLEEHNANIQKFLQ